MNLPSFNELVPHCKIEIDAFRILYLLYDLLQGHIGTTIAEKVVYTQLRGQKQNWNTLQDGAYISVIPGVGMALTQRGVDVVEVAVIQCGRHAILRFLYYSMTKHPEKRVFDNEIASALQITPAEVESLINTLEGQQHVARGTIFDAGRRPAQITAQGISKFEGDEERGRTVVQEGDTVLGHKNTTHGPYSPIQTETQNTTQTVAVAQQHQNHLPKESTESRKWISRVIEHPVISTVIGGVILGLVVLVIYCLWGYNLFDPSSSKPLWNTPTSPATPTTRQ